MFEIGRLCVKLAGRDAGKKCVVVEILEKHLVLIDGETRRRKCNINHLEPLEQKLELKKGATHQDVAKTFEKLGLTARNTKPKKAEPRKKKVRAKKEKPVTIKKTKEVKKTPKKETTLEATVEKPVEKPVIKELKKTTKETEKK